MQTCYIIGAGAIGKALAALLTHEQRNVVLLRGRSDMQGDRELVRMYVPDEQVLETTLTIQSIDQIREFNGVVVLTNKSFGNAVLAETLHRARHVPMVLLQNGLGIEQPFLDKGFEQVYRCVLFATSQFDADGNLRFRPVAPSPIGAIRGDHTTQTMLANTLHTPLFPFRSESDIQPVIWKKVIANCVFNSICPLLETDNGIFHRDAHALALAARIVRECLVVATAQGLNLAEADVLENIRMISRASDGQLISTLQDIRKKRPTEIETLNFAIARLAQQAGLEQAVTETRLLGELVKFKSTSSLTTT